jgi:predicted NBD/HSP70 family sugar kinase
MEHFAGLDVSVNETSVCIVDETGRIVREVKVASEPDALLQVLKKGPTASGALISRTKSLLNRFEEVVQARVLCVVHVRCSRKCF